jgi:HEAT repeat protein
MGTVENLKKRAEATGDSFTELRKMAKEFVAESLYKDCLSTAKALFAAESYQARSLAVYLFGHLAADSKGCLKFLRTRVSKDKDWRVQEILAQAFDQYCAHCSYEKVLPIIKDWLNDPHPNVRRAVTEGLRIWTGRPYFCDHPDIAIKLLSQLREDRSEYVRKSVGNALRDISKKHKALVETELQKWDVSRKDVLQTYKLASKFI